MKIFVNKHNAIRKVDTTDVEHPSVVVACPVVDVVVGKVVGGEAVVVSNEAKNSFTSGLLCNH